MEGGNNQLFITLPKRWAFENNLKKGDWVSIDIFNEPSKKFLEKMKEDKEMVGLTSDKIKSKKSRIDRFLENGVLLDSGFWMKFSDIKKISRSVIC